MKSSFKNTMFVVLTLMALIVGALGVTSASAAITVTNGMAASLVLGQPDFTSGAANNGGLDADSMANPIDVTVDPATGKVFVADLSNHRVLRFASTASLTNNASAEAVFGQPDFATNSSGTTAAKMFAPYGVAVDSAGRLWVSDTGNQRVLRFDSAATAGSGVSANAVLGQADFTSSSGGTAQNKFNSPQGLTVDAGGRLWVADYNNCRVLRFDSAASLSFLANASGVLGQADFTSSGCATTQTGMQLPTSLKVDNSGNLWVGDHNNRRVLRFTSAATKLNGDPADVVLGQADFVSAVAAATQNTMRAGRGIAFDNATDRLFVPDNESNRVLVFNNASTLTNGANASNVIGQSNFTNSGAGVTATTLNVPWGAFFDPVANVLLVADFGNSRVLMYGATCSASVTVTSNADSGAGTLRQAIADVCVGGTIDFAAPLSGQTIRLASTLTVDKNMTIDGSALSPQVILDGDSDNNGSGNIRIMSVNGGVTATINGLAFNKGSSSAGSGIYNAGTLTVRNSLFTGNVTADKGGALYNSPTATMYVNGSTFIGNTSTWGGGAIQNDANPFNQGGVLYVSNSTFYNNTDLNGYGGAFHNGRSFYGNVTATLYNNTFSNNSNGVFVESGTVHLVNNIVANSTGSDLAGSFATNSNNLTGVVTLNPLASNGGPTQTMSLPSSSLALGAGSAAVCANAYVNNLDQRAQARPQGDPVCDIGAYESTLTLSHTVTFNGNGADGGSMAPQTAGSTTALTLNAFTRTGYSFTGWNTAANGSGTAYADGATYSFAADITLFAQWSINPPGAFTKSSPADGNISNGTSVTLNWNASAGAASYEYCLDETSGATCDTTWINIGNVLTVNQAALPANSTFYWQIRAVNANPSMTEADGGTWWSFIKDNTAPNLSVPGPMFAEATSAAGRIVFYVPATATDTVDPAPVVECLPASGSTFPLGANTINCTATDDAGNVANGSFTITVTDTTDPVLTVPANMVVEATSAAGAVVNYPAATATDAVDPAPVLECLPASGSTFPLGVNTVNCTATDSSSNVANGSFTIEVVDTTDPILSLPANMSVSPNIATGAVVNFTATATDTVDPNPVVACVPPSGSTFPFGTTTVNCTATDDSGNVANSSFTITVGGTAYTMQFRSNGANDGHILESTETSGVGGTMNSAATQLYVGDDAANKQYLSILSFDTSPLPDNAVITKVTLKFKHIGFTGSSPFTTHGNLLVDIRKGPFNNAVALQLGDFKASPTKFKVLAYNATLTGGWYVKSFAAADFNKIHKADPTQFRLRFAKDDNNDLGADFLKIFSGNAGAANRPQLIVEYFVP